MAERSNPAAGSNGEASRRGGYHIADLAPKEIERLRELEETLAREHGEEVILIAYAPNRPK